MSDTVIKSEKQRLSETLQVIDRLAIGPVRMEPRRFIAPYSLFRNGKQESIDLIYRFEEDVFDPAEPASHNLAAMIGAQVALNYGLFCKEIRFTGSYDNYDRHFLEEMAQNTAREIYVKRFLEPNPFLRGAAAQLPEIKLENYLLAKLSFQEEPVFKKAKAEKWKVDRSGHGVLSSGGKDSLLSFGLLNEIGAVTHPIFINESGRHWYTALNAFRHFREKVPNTARVWTNADRIFSWMLRHLPFIRSDFADVRSDDYPIRLWTVAVFLFGALPLLRKRGIGRRRAALCHRAGRAAR